MNLCTEKMLARIWIDLTTLPFFVIFIRNNYKITTLDCTCTFFILMKFTAGVKSNIFEKRIWLGRIVILLVTYSQLFLKWKCGIWFRMVLRTKQTVLHTAEHYVMFISNLFFIKVQILQVNISPDSSNARHLQSLYQKTLPSAEIREITKYCSWTFRDSSMPSSKTSYLATHPVAELHAMPGWNSG